MASDTKRSSATIVGTVESSTEITRGNFTCHETIIVEDRKSTRLNSSH